MVNLILIDRNLLILIIRQAVKEKIFRIKEQIPLLKPFHKKNKKNLCSEWEIIIPREGDPCVPLPTVIQASDGGLLISGWHLIEGQEGAKNDLDIDLIKTVPMQDISVSTTGYSAFNALIILVLISGFFSLLRRRS